MAKNFQIDTRVDGRKNLRVRLAGDFDGTSACELLNGLREKAAKYSRVTVETQDLKSVESFGLQIVASRISKRSPGGGRIGFTGNYGPRFARNEGAEDHEKNNGRGTDPEQPREGFMSIS